MLRPIRFLVFIQISLLVNALGIAQSGEFRIYPNGLMYSDTTMKQLEFIVDSLNIKFRTCELNKTYFSKYQSLAHHISMGKGKIKEAKQDIENNISYKDFLKKYPKVTTVENLVVVRYSYTDYNGNESIEFGSILPEYKIHKTNNSNKYHQPLNRKWIMSYWEGSKYSEESLNAFYFTTEFEKLILPESYARMIQYSNCLVDTNSQIFKPEAQRKDFSYDEKKPVEISRFIKYVNKDSKKPEYDRENYEEYRKKYKEWDSLRWVYIDKKLSRENEFKKLLNGAVVSALEEGGSDDEFEEYVGRYYSKETELELKRSRIVVGQCSMDDRPRIHAMNIAVLSAETINWETFLRAHLNIMNDRFDRVSDGSWAWAGRKTYIRELEELDINVPDLLLGISLRIENPSQNHYYGSIGRIGRALSETRNSDVIESRILDMIKDEQLDSYNRILMYYLFLNYTYYLEDENHKKENIRNLKIAIRRLPEHLSTRMNIDELEI